MQNIETQELYFSVDIEADGEYPLDYSMLSFGCVAVLSDGTIVGSFERNLETLPDAKQSKDTMEWWSTQPTAWEICRRNLVAPKTAMPDFVKWVDGLSKQYRLKPVLIAYPASYDFLWMYVYMMKFAGRSPFAFNCLDIKSYAACLLKKPFRETTKRNFPNRWKNSSHRHTHEALTDAIGQAEMFVKMLKENTEVE